MRISVICGTIVFVSLSALLGGCGDGERQVPSNRSRRAVGGSGGAESDTASTAGTNPGTNSGGAGGGAGIAGVAGVAGVAVKVATPIALSGDPALDRNSNALGMQGLWSTSVGTNSTLSLVLDNGNLCMSGTTATVPLLEGTTYDYANYSGAMLSLDLCHSSASDDPPDVAYSLGTCPWSAALASSIAGVRFTIAEGATLPRELRVVFKEQGRETSRYVVAPSTGQVTALIADATVPADSAAPLIDVSKLESIQIYAFPSRRADYPYSVCIGKVEILTGSGWSSIPDWVSEPGPGLQVEFAGVNLAGAEFGEQNLPGTYGTDYIYPGTADIDIYSNYRMNIIRLPFRWERLQRSLGAELDPDELARLKSAVQYATGRGMAVILDPHNFGRYGAGVIGADVDIAAFADFWGRLAAVYGQDTNVILGLMNEPHDMPSTESWLSAANAAIAAIRNAGAENLVLVPGNNWTGAHSWAASGSGTSNAQVMLGVVDSGNNFAFELHQYLDSDSSGTHAACVSETIGAERVQQATEWLRTNNYRGFLGEFNAGANETCYKAIDGLLTYIGQNSDVWMGWAVWAGGPWWGENILTVQPRADGTERPQMLVLKRHLSAQ